uniref:Non-structural maintenance of chromosomes element 4 n=1 Tax=Glossina pallidipes TaxID=7398 RepID=A0A1A9Z5J5_GLOPL
MDISSQQSTERKQRYKELLNDLKKQNDIDHNFSVNDLVKLQRNIEINNEIHEENATAIKESHNNNAEILMDAHILKGFHEVISKALVESSEFNDAAYAHAINSFINRGEKSDWDVLANIAMEVNKAVYTKSSMLGAADIEPRERLTKERQKRRPKALTQEKRPDVIGKLKRKDRGAEKINIILKQVNDLYKANNCQPIPFYKLIIDPENFMNTVENAFQISFLVRDGNIAIERGDDSYPQIRVANSDEVKNKTETTQAICSLNMELCEKMKNFYGIEEPMLVVPEDEDLSGESEHSENDDVNVH